MKRYPIELKEKVLSEYSRGECGYKLLAKKYNLKRDTVREWVLAKRRKEEGIEAKEEPGTAMAQDNSQKAGIPAEQ